VPKSILVVEDDRDIREIMATFLRGEGYVVSTAANGREALELLRAGPGPDVILLDLMMPVMDGIRFREEQEKNPAIADIPVVLMSAVSQGEIAKLNLGAAVLLQKPIDIEALALMLKRF
jgi:CheY-like chemotaxis protein